MATATTTTSTTNEQAAERLHARDLSTLLPEVGYAAAALVDEAVRAVRDLPEVEELPARARATANDLQAQLRAGVERARGDVEDLRARATKELEDLRARATRELEARVAALETTVQEALDVRAEEGRRVVETVLDDDRVAALRDQLTAVEDQVRTVVDRFVARDEDAVDTTTEDAAA